MIQRVFHFGHSLFELIGHSNMHHNSRNEPSKSNITGRQRDRIEIIVVVLMLNQREQRHLEAKDEANLRQQHDPALAHLKILANQLSQVWSFLLLDLLFDLLIDLFLSASVLHEDWRWRAQF